ncbi:uncharacterized protein [Nicotiana sylvestris]|uniref:uncharacterized protein n=1 Tax=Nicotiana sylvestris TaxID=4096 RepID=UPI00388C3901
MWRHYLYGIHVDIYTDHKSLHYIIKQKELNLHQRRWLELLKDYDVGILYHPGKANIVADTLSHRSMGSMSYLRSEKREIAHEVHQLASLGVQILDLGGIGITLQNTKEKTPFGITQDGVLRYQGRLCVSNVAVLRRQMLLLLERISLNAHVMVCLAPGCFITIDSDVNSWCTSSKSEVTAALYTLDLYFCQRTSKEQALNSSHEMCIMWDKVLYLVLYNKFVRSSKHKKHKFKTLKTHQFPPF